MKVVVLRGITTKTQRFTPAKDGRVEVVDLDDAVAPTFIRGGAAREATEDDIRISGYVEPEAPKAEKPAPTKKVAAEKPATPVAVKDDDL